MKSLSVNGQFVTQVDDCDFEFVSQWKWGWKRSRNSHGAKIYVKRSKGVWRNNIRVKTRAVYLHHVIMELKGQPRPSKNHDCDHINGNAFDNTRDNLRWRHKKLNRARR